MTLSVNLTNVSKTFSKRTIIENISFSFQRGCYCLIGPNGIGKTTLLDILAGVQIQDSGNVNIIDSANQNNTSLEYKKRLCYIPGKASFYPSATGREFLNFVMSTKDINKDQLNYIYNIIQDFKIDTQLDTKFGEMSLGTQKKMFLTTMLMGLNQLIILDEPTNGLDNQSNAILCGLLKRLSNHGIIIIATHDQNLITSLNTKTIKLHQSPIKSLILSEN